MKKSARVIETDFSILEHFCVQKTEGCILTKSHTKKLLFLNKFRMNFEMNRVHLRIASSQ